MNVNINQLELPKASAYAAEALEIITRPEPDSKKLERAIMCDPILASTLLRYANSPLNRRYHEITNVPAALRLLGLKSVHSAIVTATMHSLLQDDSALGKQIIEHMVDTSMMCKLIARHCCRTAADDLEFLGLIHDVGMLVLASNFAAPYRRIVKTAMEEAIEIDRLEYAEFGLSHDSVSAHVAHDFRLPALHVELLRSFHQREPITEVNDDRARDICVLALAHRLLNESVEAGPRLPETILETGDQLKHALSMSDQTIDGIVGEYSALTAGKTDAG